RWSSDCAGLGVEVTVFEVDRIDKSFGGVAALDQVSFAVGEREIVGVIGHNGSGKSTIINVISGFYRPDGGDVRLAGKSLVGRDPAAIRAAGVGRTFQNLRLVGTMSVLDNALAGFYLEQTRGIPLTGAWVSDLLGLPSARRRAAHARESVEAALTRVGLGEKLATRVDTLSYADQKRVELARALALPPRLLILDEPTAGMSVDEADELIRGIVSIVREAPVPMSLLLVEHRLELVLNVSDRAIVMDGGRVIVDDLPAVVADDPEVRRIYVG